MSTLEDIHLTFLDKPPLGAVIESMRRRLKAHRDILQAGMAVQAEGVTENRPMEFWFVNRLVLQVDGLHVILEKGAPLSPITNEEIKQEALNFVAKLADKPMSAAEQAVALKDFVARVMKGRVHAGT